jgi:hypothetical protein
MFGMSADDLFNYAMLWLWIPGSALSGCPGMTMTI